MRLSILLLVAVACVLSAHAVETDSPTAKQLEEQLNDMREEIMTDPLQQALFESDRANAREYDEHLAALESGGASWVPEEQNAEEMSLSETQAELDAEEEFGIQITVDKTGKTSTKAKEDPAQKKFAKDLQNLVAGGQISSKLAKKIITLNKAAAAKAKAKGKKGSGSSAGPAGGSGGSGGASNVRGPSGGVVKSLKLVTGSGAKNSQCFACQYFVQRTLGALLGPFYSNANAGPAEPEKFRTPLPIDGHTATPKPHVKQYRATSTAIEALDRSPQKAAQQQRNSFNVLTSPDVLPTASSYVLAEAEAQAQAELAEEASEELAAIEIDALIAQTLPDAPSAEEAQEQYEKWEPYLPEHMKETSLVEVDAEVEADKKPKLPKSASKSVKSRFGKMYNKFQIHAVRAFFSDLCNRRVPTEWQKTCFGLYKNIDAVVEELSVGDRPDEVCIRHKMCPKGSYIFKGAHTAVRKED